MVARQFGDLAHREQLAHAGSGSGEQEEHLAATEEAGHHAQRELLVQVLAERAPGSIEWWCRFGATSRSPPPSATRSRGTSSRAATSTTSVRRPDRAAATPRRAATSRLPDAALPGDDDEAPVEQAGHQPACEHVIAPLEVRTSDEGLTRCSGATGLRRYLRASMATLTPLHMPPRFHSLSDLLAAHPDALGPHDVAVTPRRR